MRDRYAEAGGRGLAVMRMLLGGLLLFYGAHKLTPQYAVDLPGALSGLAMTIPHEWYRAFLLDTVVPHAGLFAALIVLGELVIGACFVLGLGVGLAGPLGCLMFVNYYLATGQTAESSIWGNLFLAATALVCSTCYAGCTWGADAALSRTMPVRALYPFGLGRWR